MRYTGYYIATYSSTYTFQLIADGMGLPVRRTFYLGLRLFKDTVPSNVASYLFHYSPVTEICPGKFFALEILLGTAHLELSTGMEHYS